MAAYESLKTFAIRLGIVGGIGTFICVNSVPLVYNKKIRNSDHYKQAIKLLRGHTEAVKCLGEPIKEGFVKVTDPKEFGRDEEKMWINVPVYGSKTNGKLFYDFILKTEENQPTKLLRVELTLDSHKDYKLLIKREEML